MEIPPPAMDTLRSLANDYVLRSTDEELDTYLGLCISMSQPALAG